jgi:ribonuclease HII
MPRLRDTSDLVCTLRFEGQAWRRGWRLVAGTDEAGRGALAGPLYAAAVILDRLKPIRGLDDSKKLTPQIRQKLAGEVRRSAVAWQVVEVPAEEVDALNVYEASRQAMLRALGALDPQAEFVLTDAMPLVRAGDLNGYTTSYRAIIHGDARSASIAAASILAKVERDRKLDELDRFYPQYGLKRNKGYGTAEHLAALHRFGPCAEHRKTFQPVKDCLLPLFPLAQA